MKTKEMQAYAMELCVCIYIYIYIFSATKQVLRDVDLQKIHS